MMHPTAQTASPHRKAFSRPGVALLIMVFTFIFWEGPAELNAAERKDFGKFELTSTESLQVLNKKIRTGDTLGNILRAHRVPYSAINAIERASREVFDVRNLRAGNSYFLINELDSADRFNYLVYERSLIDYVVFKLDTPVEVYKGKKQFELKERIVTGMIESTLFKALSGEPVSYELALKITEVFAYLIDFHHLQKGDFFKAVYTQKHLGSGALALADILAVRFNHRGRDYFAFYFDQQDQGRYYDQNGNSLEKRFLKAPLRYAVITSPYLKKRLHPIRNRYTPHLGIDYAAPKGTPIMSVSDGVVTRAEYQRNSGNFISIAHSSIYTTQYLHLAGFAKGIHPGAVVKRKDIIGFVGSTGIVTGPHVEYRLYKNGIPIDPQKEDMPSGEPLNPEYAGIFLQKIAELKKSLNNTDLSTRSLEKSFARR